ncbi:MAG: phosphotransferase family protein, partial [Robiginitalea sp.]
MPENDLTTAVRKGEELSEKNLLRFLLDQGLVTDESSPMSVRQFYNGYSNLTYLLKIGEREYVLRRPPFSAPKRGHDMGREFKVLHNLKKVFDKIPEVYAYSEDADILGAPFYIMEKVDGIILTEKEARERNITPTGFRKVADTWLDTFVELHQVDYSAAGLESLGKPQGYVGRQVTTWGKQYLAAATEEVPT